MSTSTTCRALSAAAELLAGAPLHRRPLASASASASAARIAPQPPDLIRWVRREGGFVHPNLKIAHHSSVGLGLIASGDIPNGSELVALPDHLPLRLRWSPDADDPNDRPDSTLHQLVHRVPEELWALRLGLKLVKERATVGSYWWPYIGNLPEAFSNPIFFSGDEIKSLHYAPITHQVNKRCRFLIDFEREIEAKIDSDSAQANAKHPFGGQQVTAGSLGWAMSAVSSRAFRLDGQNSGDEFNTPVLLPLIDMCNHSFDPNARIVQEPVRSTGCKALVGVVAGTRIEKGAPVTLNYGCLSNDLFLLDYGFVVPSNPFDHVELKYDEVLLDAASMAAGIASPHFSAPAPWQHEVLSRLNLVGDGADLKVNLGGSDLVDNRLIAALRVLLAADEKMINDQNLGALMTVSSDAPPLGARIEIDALRTVIALSAICLQHFPTKIAEDESLLKGDMSMGTKLAIQFRMNKKLMIINAMKELSKRIRQLGLESQTVRS